MPLSFWASKSFSSLHLDPNCQYVYNSHFEISNQIVTTQNQLNRATNWQSAHQGTSDYFHNLASLISGYSVPTNIAGTQDDFYAPIENAYAGFAAHLFLPPNFHVHEYVQQRLRSPLLSNVRYAVSFKVNLADLSQYSSNDIGIYFSVNRPFNLGKARLQQTAGGPFVNPQISSSWNQPNLPTGFVTDKDQWITISGTIIGNGEEWITIGGFNDNLPFVNNSLAYYLLDDVSIVPIEFNITPNPISSCPGVPVQLFTTPSQWVDWAASTPVGMNTNYGPTTVLTNLPMGNTQITGTINFPYPLNQCISTANATVTITNSPSIQVTASPYQVVAGQSSLLTAYNTGFSPISWSPTFGLSSSTIPNPIFTYPYTTTYEATVNLGAGCEAKGNVTIEVIQPECNPAITFDYSSDVETFSSNIINTLNATNAAIIGKNIYISGILTVDVSITFIACNIMMGENAVINVKDGSTLTISEKTHIYSCSAMWQGITATSSAESIVINGNSIIEDAIKAIDASNCATVLLDNAILNNNLYGIYIQSCNSTLSPLTIRSSILCSRYLANNINPLLNTDVSTLRQNIKNLLSFPLKAPYSKAQIGVFGIFLEDNNFVQVGDCGQITNFNIFDKLVAVFIVQKPIWKL